MMMLDWLLIAGLGALVSVLVAGNLRASQQRDRLQDAFYRLLETENGCVSLIQLATLARVDAAVAQAYLDEQSRSFQAVPEVDADGDLFYRFPKLRRSQ